MEDLYIYHKKFGKCKVLAFYQNIAILELKNNYEKFVVTIGLSKKTNSWQRGFYYKHYEDAFATYNNFLDDFYQVFL